MADDYLKAHYAKYGSLDDVYYFDCTETLPALSFFDIRDQLDAGIDRTTAVEDVVDHYIDIGRQSVASLPGSSAVTLYACAQVRSAVATIRAWA